jgi:hypothetical protein
MLRVCAAPLSTYIVQVRGDYYYVSLTTRNCQSRDKISGLNALACMFQDQGIEVLASILQAA